MVEPTINRERVHLDDEALRKAYERFRRLTSIKEEQFNNKIRSTDENNYMELAVARLAYGFVKEEYDLLANEMRVRGLRPTP